MPATPPSLAPLADGFYLQQQQTARAASATAQEVWRGLPADGLVASFDYWREEGIPAVADAITVAQYANAERAAAYVATSAALQGAASTDVPALEATGFLSATEDIERWLRSPLYHLAALVTQGAPLTQAKTTALSTLVRQTATLAQDAGREATGVGIVAHPGLTGYYRKLRTPSCKRCAVMAGAFYRDNDGFKRHPLCDCIHVPAAGEYDDAAFDTVTAIERGQITGLTEAERKAIVEDGADVSQVLNATTRKGGLQTTSMFGDRVQITSEGTTARGLAGKRLGDLQKVGGRYRVAKRVRLSPNEIYRQAGADRALARRLLERNGYIT